MAIIGNGEKSQPVDVLCFEYDEKEIAHTANQLRAFDIYLGIVLHNLFADSRRLADSFVYQFRMAFENYN